MSRLCLQAIVRGSFIGHGDYISHVISELSRLSVSSSNSLRRSSPSARKRARSLGRLGELAEDESYQFEEVGRRSNSVKTAGGSTYWQDRIRQVRSESGSPKLNGALQRPKSAIQVRSEDTPLMPVTPQRTGETDESIRQYACSEGEELRPRPMSCHYNLQTVEARRAPRRHQAATQLPDLLSSSRETPRRPRSSYDANVRLVAGLSSKGGQREEQLLVYHRTIPETSFA